MTQMPHLSLDPSDAVSSAALYDFEYVGKVKAFCNQFQEVLISFHTIDKFF